MFLGDGVRRKQKANDALPTWLNHSAIQMQEGVAKGNSGSEQRTRLAIVHPCHTLALQQCTFTHCYDVPGLQSRAWQCAEQWRRWLHTRKF
jgi:hypothetical protein